jgi:uncharacterized sporulation protein YeaH/YhbH (DUF444 family)
VCGAAQLDVGAATAGREAAELEAWLARGNGTVAARFIFFDAVAHEVSREAFFGARPAAGGTMISSALGRCIDIIDADYAKAEWRVFAVVFTDGDDWSPEDNAKCMGLIRDRLLPHVTAFGLAQLEHPYGQGEFLTDVQKQFSAKPRVIAALLTKNGGFAQAFARRVAESLPTVVSGPAKPARKRRRSPKKKK